MTDTKKELQERFERLFPQCKLACIHLNGFSHSVFYIDAEGFSVCQGFSDYLSNSETDGKKWNSDRVRGLFLGYSHIFYQNNAKEFIYMSVDKFKKYPKREA